MDRRIKAGTTDVSVVIRIVDSTDGTPETAVTAATGGLDLQYRREGAVSTAITESDLSALTDAHSDGGLLHIGNGYYRLDLPDAAGAVGVTGVLVHGTATGMVVIGTYIELVAYDPYDTVRLGLTALPNAAADAAGGLPISDAGALDLDALNAAVTSTGVVISAATANQIRDAITAAVVESEGSITLQQALSIVLAYAAGQATGQATTAPVFKTPDGVANRISAVTDGSGNRSSVTLTPSA